MPSSLLIKISTEPLHVQCILLFSKTSQLYFTSNKKIMESHHKYTEDTLLADSLFCPTARAI